MTSDYEAFIKLLKALENAAYFCGHYYEGGGFNTKYDEKKDRAYQSLLDWYNSKER